MSDEPKSLGWLAAEKFYGVMDHAFSPAMEKRWNDAMQAAIAEHERRRAAKVPPDVAVIVRALREIVSVPWNLRLTAADALERLAVAKPKPPGGPNRARVIERLQEYREKMLAEGMDADDPEPVLMEKTIEALSAQPAIPNNVEWFIERLRVETQTAPPGPKAMLVDAMEMIETLAAKPDNADLIRRIEDRLDMSQNHDAGALDITIPGVVKLLRDCQVSLGGTPAKIPGQIEYERFNSIYKAKNGIPYGVNWEHIDRDVQMAWEEFAATLGNGGES
jgi:hypothetical protein